MGFKKTGILALILAACWPLAASAANVQITDPTREVFRDYWYPHGAEISRYQLTQSRYGEIHRGDAVLIFVTEFMNPELQVKADRPGPGDLPILKLNATRKFYTGIYPYSTMTSVFASIDAREYPLPLKISTSVQEWCGHVYMQRNLADSQYTVDSHSYFEKEADRRFSIPASMSEDAVWTRIRISPARLPVGEFEMAPSGLYVRLMHRPLAPLAAEATLREVSQKSIEGRQLLRYTIEFPREARTTRIWFERDFPHRIQAWEETYTGLSGEPSTTRADRTHTLMIDYWNHNRNVDRKLLDRLGLGSGD